MSKNKGKTKYDLLALAEYEKVADISFITVSDGTKLRILQSSVKSKNKEGFTLVLVAGWASIILGWDNLLMEAKKHFNILYIETREKGSSQITKDAEFDIDRITFDIKEIIEHLKLQQNKIVMLTSSFSSILAAYMLKNDMIDPYLSIFIGPIEKIPAPKSILIMLKILPKWLYVVVKIIGIWWAKNFKAEDEEHGAKTARVVREADPTKWEKAIKHFAKKYFWDVYEGFNNKVLVVDASEDIMHDTNRTQEIAKLIKNHDYIDLKTNKNTHSTSMVKTILEFIEK